MKKSNKLLYNRTSLIQTPKGPTSFLGSLSPAPQSKRRWAVRERPWERGCKGTELSVRNNEGRIYIVSGFSGTKWGVHNIEVSILRRKERKGSTVLGIRTPWSWNSEIAVISLGHAMKAESLTGRKKMTIYGPVTFNQTKWSIRGTVMELWNCELWPLCCCT